MMTDARIPTIKSRVRKRSNHHQLLENQHSSSSSIGKPKITSVIHVSIRPTTSARSSSQNKAKRRSNTISTTPATNESFNRSEKSIDVKRVKKQPTSAKSSVSVTKVSRASSKCRSNSFKTSDNTSQKSAYKNNNERDSSIKIHRPRTAKVADHHSIITRKSITINPLGEKGSLGTIEDLTNSVHNSHPLAKNKNTKNLINYLCRCTRRRVVLSLITLISLGIILTIILTVLLKTWPTTVNQPSRVAYLRWNNSGITVFGTAGLRGNTSSQFFNPFGLLLNSYNEFYIADRQNHRIQRCRIGELNCTTIAGRGNGVRGNNTSDLYGPTYILFDSNNNLYISDSGNHRVQFWNNGASYGSTIAGVTGSSGPALNQFNIPYGLALDSSSNTIYVSDCNNHRVMKYSLGATNGTIVAGGNGSGSSNTQLNCPAGLYLDSSTNSLIIVNFGASNIVRWVLGDNKWTIIAASPNGLNGNTSTLLDHPTTMIYDPMGNMYVADMFNHRIQMYLYGQSNATTIAGITGRFGNNSTMLYYPVSLVLDNQLNLYVTDSFNQRIQKYVRY